MAEIGLKLSMELDQTGYNKSVAKYLAKVSPDVRDEIIRAMFFELLGLVIDKTPVREGRARGGFGAGADALGAKLDFSGATAKDDGAIAEGRALSKFEEEKRTTGIRLTVTNAVVYIEPLEKGSSTQAPFGMLQISLREMQQRLGGRRIPEGVREIYAETWRKNGLEQGASLRASDILRALGVNRTKGLRK